MQEKPSEQRGERRFSLWQTAIVLVALAILVAMVAPDVGQFLSAGQKRAYEADLRLLKAAVDSWHNEKVHQQGAKPWPTFSGTNGMPKLPTNTYIDIALLAQENYLRGSDIIASADVSKNSTATNSPSGSYGWFVEENGMVSSTPPFDGKYP